MLGAHQSFLSHGNVVTNAVLQRAHLVNTRTHPVIFSLFESGTSARIEECSLESTRIANILRAKRKSAGASWLWCTTDNTVYDVVKSEVVSDSESAASSTFLASDYNKEEIQIQIHPDISEGDGGDGNGSGDGSGGGSGGDNNKGNGEGEGEGESDEGSNKSSRKMAMSMSQKLTLGYAALVGVGGFMGYIKSGSQKSLLAGGISASLLYLVFTLLPTKPAFASALGLGLSAALLGVMGSRFKKSGKIFPAGVVSLASLVMSGGYLHGILRSMH